MKYCKTIQTIGYSETENRDKDKVGLNFAGVNVYSHAPHIVELFVAEGFCGMARYATLKLTREQVGQLAWHLINAACQEDHDV